MGVVMTVMPLLSPTWLSCPPCAAVACDCTGRCSSLGPFLPRGRVTALARSAPGGGHAPGASGPPTSSFQGPPGPRPSGLPSVRVSGPAWDSRVAVAFARPGWRGTAPVGRGRLPVFCVPCFVFYRLGQARPCDFLRDFAHFPGAGPGPSPAKRRDAVEKCHVPRAHRVRLLLSSGDADPCRADVSPTGDLSQLTSGRCEFNAMTAKQGRRCHLLCCTGGDTGTQKESLGCPVSCQLRVAVPGRGWHRRSRYDYCSGHWDCCPLFLPGASCCPEVLGGNLQQGRLRGAGDRPTTCLQCPPPSSRGCGPLPHTAPGGPAALSCDRDSRPLIQVPQGSGGWGLLPRRFGVGTGSFVSALG